MKNLFYVFLTSQLVFNSGLYAQEAPPMRDQGFTQTMVMMAIALLFFYFILWRPEQKRRKALDEQRNALRQGDKVTAVGIVGTVVRIQENTVILKMYDGSKIEVLKGAITDVMPDSEQTTPEKSDKNN